MFPQNNEQNHRVFQRAFITIALDGDCPITNNYTSDTLTNILSAKEMVLLEHLKALHDTLFPGLSSEKSHQTMISCLFILQSTLAFCSRFSYLSSLCTKSQKFDNFYLITKK